MAGPAPWLALLLCLAACTRAPQARQPLADTELAVQALRRGDVAALREAYGFGPGLADRAREAANRLDPRAWLVFMGASWRQHDLAACRRALDAGDDPALAHALGFGEQALRADVLDAGRTVIARRADGKDYYGLAPAPISRLPGGLPTVMPERLDAWQLSLWRRVDDRIVRIRIGRNRHGLTDLQAAEDIAFAEPALDGPQHRTLPEAASEFGQGLQWPDLPGAEWPAVEARLLGRDGALTTLRLRGSADGWTPAHIEHLTLTERLELERDRRLDYVQRRIAALERTSGRWPRGLHEMSFRPLELVDPADPQARRGWADHDDSPEPMIVLGEPAGPFAARCRHHGPQGHRAITRDAVLFWFTP